MDIGKNIRFLRYKADMSQHELARLLGYKSFTTVQKWESGVSSPPLGNFIQMADIFNVDLDDFARKDLSAPDYILRIDTGSRPVPVYGRIPAGMPLEAVEDISGYIQIEGQGAHSGHDYFALVINGNSMQPKYHNEDIVIFEHQSTCENGDECAVRLNGEDATFKKIRKLTDGIILQPLNPEYEPIQISSADLQYVEILGIAREIRRKV